VIAPHREHGRVQGPRRRLSDPGARSRTRSAARLDKSGRSTHAIKAKQGAVALVERHRAHKSRSLTDVLPSTTTRRCAESLPEPLGSPRPRGRSGDPAFGSESSGPIPTRRKPSEGLSDTVTINRLGVTSSPESRSDDKPHGVHPSTPSIKAHRGTRSAATPAPTWADASLPPAWPVRGAVAPGERLPPARPPRRQHHHRVTARSAPPHPRQLMTPPCSHGH